MEMLATDVIVSRWSTQWKPREHDGCAFIYAIKCKANEKIYIGRTQQPRSRIKQHIMALRRNKHPITAMQSDFNKYGEDSFVCKFICSTDNKLDDTEKRNIVLFGAYDPERGYNNDTFAKKVRCKGVARWKD